MGQALKHELYAIHKTWEQNIEEGPNFFEEIPARRWEPRSEWKELLGIPVASPLGIPAGPLLDSRWIDLAAKLGYDIVTYKTVRSVPQSAHPLPNVLFVEAPGPLSASQVGETIVASDNPPQEMERLSITNSFGNPSMSRDYLQEDLVKAREGLQPGQVMIASVFGTPGIAQDVADDYVATALMAKEAGVEMVEANFSCPNVSAGEGSLFADEVEAPRIAKKMVGCLGDVPLIIKMGVFQDKKMMERVIVALAKAGVRGICGINTLSMHVVDRAGNNALGELRPASGICGAAIREIALEFISEARRIITRNQLNLALLGCGGITQPRHFDEMLAAGADAALTATGMMWNPFLASQWHQQKG